MELKENIGEDSMGFFAMDTPSGSLASDSMSEEALEVLTTLGVSRTEAFSLVAAARKDAKNVNELVMAVLQRLDK